MPKPTPLRTRHQGAGNFAAPAALGLQWARHLAVVGAVWLVALAAYSNSFRGGMVHDAPYLIEADSRVHAATSGNISLIWNEEYWYKTGMPSGLYRPLTTLSFLFNYAVLGNGAEPAGYHWINFGLHAVNILLVYALAYCVTRKIRLAGAIAAVWGLHPLAVEAVTNLAGRADLLAAFGVLAGLMCHIRAGERHRYEKSLWLAALMFSAALGMFSKESAIVLPALMALYDLAFRTSPERPTPPWRRLLPGYLALAPPLIAYFALRAEMLRHSPPIAALFFNNPLTVAGFWAGRLTAVKILGEYLYLLFWPLHLSADYSYNQIPLFAWRLGEWESWKVVLALAIWIAITAMGIRAFRRKRSIFFFVAFFAVAIAPTSNLILQIGTVMAERLLYLPSVGFAGCAVVAAAAGFARLTARLPAARWAPPAVLVCVCLAFACRTYARNFDWYDTKSLWSQAVQAAPDSFKTHSSLAEALWSQGPAYHDAAMREREKAVAILRDRPDAQQYAPDYLALGICYREKGEQSMPAGGSLTAGSRAWYERSVGALLHAGSVSRPLVELLRGRPAADYPQPQEIDLARAYLELGRTYRDVGEVAHALDAFETGRKIERDPAFYAEIARTHESQGDLHAAEIALLEGLVDDPNQAGFAAKAVSLYKRTDARNCAALNGVGGLNDACPAVHGDLCAAGLNMVRLFGELGRARDVERVRKDTLERLYCPAR